MADYGERAEEIGEFLLSRDARRTAASCAAGRAGGPAIWPWRPTTHGWSKPACACRSGRAGRCGGNGRSSWAPSCSTCSGTRSRAASSRPAATPRRWWCARRSFSTVPSPRPTPSPWRHCCGPTRSRDDARLDQAVERTIALARPLLDRHPGGARRPGGGAAHVERAPRDRRHRRPARPARRGPPALASRRRRRVGPARQRTAVRRAAGRTRAGLRLPGALVRAPAADVETLAGQLEALVGVSGGVTAT